MQNAYNLKSLLKYAYFSHFSKHAEMQDKTKLFKNKIWLQYVDIDQYLDQVLNKYLK